MLQSAAAPDPRKIPLHARPDNPTPLAAAPRRPPADNAPPPIAKNAPANRSAFACLRPSQVTRSIIFARTYVTATHTVNTNRH